MNRRAILGLAALAAALPGVAAASGGDGDKKKTVAGPGYVAIDTLTGATNKPGGRRGVLTVECGLDVQDSGLRTRAEQSRPRLRAAYAQIVQIYAAGLPTGAPPNIDFLARSLQRQTDQVLGRPGARLLLGSVLVN